VTGPACPAFARDLAAANSAGLITRPAYRTRLIRMLTGGVRVRDVLRTVEAVAGAGVPALVMTYWNQVRRAVLAAGERA
jgi:hypothetical protein